MIKRKLLSIYLQVTGRNHFDYMDYWDKRYLSGDTSGMGSYGILAEYKAKVINDFVKDNSIVSVIEFGCGDGNQLKYMGYKKYLGLDISKASIELIKKMFVDDKTKSFMLYDPKYFVNNFIKADLVVCLDVLYHIIPEEEFIKTLEDIFSASSEFVIIYTSIDAFKSEPYNGGHVYHRDTLKYFERFPDFKIEKIVEQEHKDLSSASFIILKRIKNS